MKQPTTTAQFIPSKLAETLPAGVTNRLHSWPVSIAGILAVLGGIALPVVTLFCNSQFVDALLYGASSARVGAFHQLVVTLVVSTAMVTAGAIGTFIGKGPLGTTIIHLTGKGP
jgi:hypothetical protein